MSDVEGVEHAVEQSNLEGLLMGRNPNASQSMRDVTASPPTRGLRKSLSAPMRQFQSPPVYAQPPNVYYPSTVMPALQPMVQPMLPVYAPPYGSPYMTQGVYYPPQQPAGVVYRQIPPPMPYPNYDSNFEVYFGPDVRPAQSSLEQQREQFESFERTRPRSLPGTHQREGISLAEAKALEDAIQLSLTESSRRASLGAGSNDAWDSDYTSVAASSTQQWTEDGLGDSSDAASKADELALQTAIMLSLTDPSTSGTTATAASPRLHDVPSAFPSRESSGLSPREPCDEVAPSPPATAADRQYPHNRTPDLPSRGSFHRQNSMSRPNSDLREVVHDRDPRRLSGGEGFSRAEWARLQRRDPSGSLSSPRTDDDMDSPRRSGYSDGHAAPRRHVPPPPLSSIPLSETRRPYDQDHDPLSPRGGDRPTQQLHRSLSERISGSFPTPRSDRTGSYATPRTDQCIVDSPRAGSVERGRPLPPPYELAVAQDSPRSPRRDPPYPLQRSASTGRPYPVERRDYGYEDRGYYRESDRATARGHQRDYGGYQDRYRDEHRGRPGPRRPVHCDHFSSKEARTGQGRDAGARRAPRTDPHDRRPSDYPSSHPSSRPPPPYSPRDEAYGYEGRSTSAPRGGGGGGRGGGDLDGGDRARGRFYPFESAAVGYGRSGPSAY